MRQSRFEWPQGSAFVLGLAIGAVGLLIFAFVKLPLDKQQPLRIMPTTTDEEILAAEEIDWEQLQEDMLAAPPKRWWTKSTDHDDQWLEFIKWSTSGDGAGFPITLLEINQQVAKWIHEGEGEQLDTEIVARNVRYHVRCRRYEDRADCVIDLHAFVGETH